MFSSVCKFQEFMLCTTDFLWLRAMRIWVLGHKKSQAPKRPA